VELQESIVSAAPPHQHPRSGVAADLSLVVGAHVAAEPLFLAGIITPSAAGAIYYLRQVQYLYATNRPGGST
jgi:NADH:ubiquinone oxidoreductase subunit 2 (subunit N)